MMMYIEQWSKKQQRGCTKMEKALNEVEQAKKGE